jgi:5-oxoprolinase (ATP-hydrolysing) subunit C
MTLRVLEPGLYTLPVDFGRPSSRSLGVPVGGAADRTALALGNALVGNPPDAVGLEITLAGPTLRADCELGCVVYGAPFELTSDRRHLTAGKTFTLVPGEELHIGGTPEGARAYFCVRGGFDQKPVLGSRSALEPLAVGADLGCLPSAVGVRFLRAPFTRDGAAPTLRVLSGPQADWFSADDFFPQEFTITPASNRMGLRLSGEPLRLPDRELVSEPVCPGSVQVTRDGQCIILGVDGQTIGGYPKIVQVITADLDRLGQLRPGDRVRFVRVSLEEAETLCREKQAELHEWVTRLRCSFLEKTGREID